MSYCDYCKDLPDENLHKIYHDCFYGFKLENDNELFGRFILEINQAGLSWDLMLKKQEAFREAYSSFSINKIANYTEQDLQRLLLNPGIIRNRLKINAVIYNAKVILQLKQKYGSFSAWLEQQQAETLEEWVKIFKKNFKFTGREIVNEFLMSTGFLSGAHVPECPVYQKIRSKLDQM